MATRTNVLVLLSVIASLQTTLPNRAAESVGHSILSKQRTRQVEESTLTAIQNTVEEQASVIQTLQSQLQAETARGEELQSSVESLTDQMQSLLSTNEDLQTQLTFLQNRLAVRSQGVGFSARFSYDGGQFVGVPLAKYSILIFDSVISNSGNSYDRNTGVFTAPVSGLYSFFLTQMTADNNHHLWLGVMKNNNTLDRIYTEGGGTNNDTHDQGASQVVAHLQAGDRVWVRQEDGTAVRGSWFTVFTGYLIQAD